MLACGSTAGSSGMQAMRALTAVFSNTGSPPTSTSPASGRSMPAMQRIAVDLPAPFGPTMPYTLPAGTVSVKPSSAAVSSKRFVTCRISIIGISSFRQPGGQLRRRHAEIHKLRRRRVELL